MTDLIVNSNGKFADALSSCLVAGGHDINACPLRFTESPGSDHDKGFSEWMSQDVKYRNIFVNCVDNMSELNEFRRDPIAALGRIECALGEVLGVLKYAAQNLVRAEGGAIWVLCMDQGASYSVDSPYNPVTNNALIACVRSLAKEVHRFGISINVIMIQPPKEFFEPEVWKKARNNLKALTMKFKPQPTERICELIRMYSEFERPPVSGAVIPVGAGIIEHNI